ncbi:MAG: PAS domain S-box protein [Nitrospira sp.]|nr:PAS domain S-box protein [Nitrospira sp.]MDH4355480.1 PAS domain S-box protein [Nitrospira sp.]MDH5317718.1 PAS domain S-box protein [Nitrospira sp.]
MISTSNLSVLDLLRRRIADLSRELAERDSVLHERTRHLRVAQSLAHLGSWDWEIESGEVRCSKELYRIFGRDPGLHHMTFEIFVSAPVPGDHDRVVAAINDALGGKAPYDVEYRIVRPNGDVRTIHCCGEVLRDDSGKPCRMSGSVLDITERKRTEAMLRSSQEKLRQALQASGIGLWDWNTETNDVVLSEEWKRQLGYEETELSDTFETWVTLLHPDDHSRAIAYMGEYARERQGEYRQEFRLRHKDGTYRWIEARASFVTETDGSQIRLLGSHTDITERKRMEEAVCESEDRYRTLVELSPSGVFVFSEGRTVYANHTGAILMGANDPKEILDRPMFDFIHPDYHDEVRENVKRLLTGNVSVHSAERIYVKMDGTSVPVQVEAARIMWNGRPAILVLFSDITDRQRAEDELRRSHTFLRQVIDADPNFIFAKDREGRFTMANKAVADCYGTTVENLIGQSDADFNPNWEEVEFSRQTDLQVMNSLQDYFMAEEKITDWSGKTRWLQSVKRPIVDTHGRAHMVLGAATDITERKQMEEMLVRREEDLSTALRERERISQDLHDGILQSLYAVGLSLVACKPSIMQQPEHIAEKLITTLDQAIGQLNHVMGELRNFITGLESHLVQGGDFPTALRTMIHSMCAANSAKCRVRVDDAAGSHISTEQAVHVVNIAREALSNALRHSHATRITLSLRQYIGSVCLAITDNGIGFSPSSVRGVGRGLANMAERAQKIGGSFIVRSEPHKGTRIVLDLPKCPNGNTH